jgi:hypothetical protein
LNPHALAGTGPSSQRVCLFRHSDLREEHSTPRLVAEGHVGWPRWPAHARIAPTGSGSGIAGQGRGASLRPHTSASQKGPSSLPFTEMFA